MTRKNTSPGLAPENLRLFTWNVQKQQSATFHEALTGFSARTDLALLQEARLDEELLGSFGDHWSYSFAHGYSTGRYTSGVMTLAASGKAHKSRSQQAREPWLRTAKATNITHYTLADREHDLLVVNIHAINFSVGTRGYREQLRGTLSDIDNHEGPVIFAGDLNTWSRERQRVLEHFVSHLDLDEVRYDVDERKRIMRRPLDYVFTRGLRVETAHAGHHPCSDHNPLEATLSC